MALSSEINMEPGLEVCKEEGERSEGGRGRGGRKEGGRGGGGGRMKSTDHGVEDYEFLRLVSVCGMRWSSTT
jgi:hypothetical protein